ncbi:molybdenum cofactor guanylyltransferase [Luteimonas marina]|uniref:Molybdenum cofactor guanylyltransferase n=1 Tax=Luteimonas marina TaxID=488485 RepID=A0A5C5UE48_9GAMM|nr:molybdenum cofactor guanylyltransferase [Luteimonas marina]TWT23715.1 molybdenum cofactor guanylyltransferase [Luteimonas marina]
MPPPAPGIASDDLTLGILAGGRATRLGGRDKAWLVRGGVPQVQRIATRFGVETGAVLVSANRELSRHAALGLTSVPDRIADAGPLSGLDALAAACRTPWLFTLPVDVVDANDCVLRMLVTQRSDHGASAQDDDGLQPLVALWRVDALREAVAAALATNAFAVHALQARLGMRVVRFEGVRFGNLNTPEDLAAAGIDMH